MPRFPCFLLLLVCASAIAAPFDPVAATQAYLDSVPADQRARSDAYFEGGYWLQVADFAIGVAVNLAILALGLSRRMRDRPAYYVREEHTSSVLLREERRNVVTG